MRPGRPGEVAEDDRGRVPEPRRRGPRFGGAVQAVVRVVSVDDDGMVHFERLADDHPDARGVLASAGDD